MYLKEISFYPWQFTSLWAYAHQGNVYWHRFFAVFSMVPAEETSFSPPSCVVTMSQNK